LAIAFNYTRGASFFLDIQDTVKLFNRTSASYSYTLSLTEPTAPVPIPEPASLTLLGFGVADLLGYAWERKRAA
jgi:hypothetical protein